ncbi:MAG: RidA family protein [Actinobacteria bacterium]|nr:RidA family protein [Actinomycetota bacterium]
MTVAQRLADLGITLPDVPAPVAAYVPAVRTGAYIYTSGQLPFVDGALMHEGLVGSDVSVADAVACARQCALNALAAVASQAGGLENVRVIKVVGFVASADGFTAQPQVVNGASEVIGDVLGELGVHARSAVGVAALPLNAPVEVEVVAEVL